MMTPRGLPMAPARSVLGQRALETADRPRHEPAFAFRRGGFHRGLSHVASSGKIVGEPTSGWIIYTGSQTLVDGSSIRMPSTRITALDGTTMELNPRPVDVPVTRPIGESLLGKDSQLDTAVRELLQQLGAKRGTAAR